MCKDHMLSKFWKLLPDQLIGCQLAYSFNITEKNVEFYISAWKRPGSRLRTEYSDLICCRISLLFPPLHPSNKDLYRSFTQTLILLSLIIWVPRFVCSDHQLVSFGLCLALICEVPRSCLKTVGDRSVVCAIPNLWNWLPLSLHLNNSFNSFKNGLKHIISSNVTCVNLYSYLTVLFYYFYIWFYKFKAHDFRNSKHPILQS